MAWWQKKLLRYALSRTGLLDDKALDLSNLDITLGKKNVIELKDVGLNIGRIAKLVQLPPSLRIETARVLSLRLTVPADIYQSSIVAEVDGVELILRLDEKVEAPTEERQKRRAQSPVTSRIPQHRKAHRRLHSPPPYDPGGFPESDARIPTTEELAKSFLLEEPIQQRRELEASVAGGEKGLEESIVSESSDASDYGTGAAIGLPGFLANFLQGIADRFRVIVRNVDAKLETEILDENHEVVPVGLRLHVGGAELTSLASDDGDPGDDLRDDPSRRQVTFSEVSLHLLSDSSVFSELSEVPSHLSPTESRQRDPSPELLRTSESNQSVSSAPILTAPSVHSSHRSLGNDGGLDESQKSLDIMQASIQTMDADRFADAGDGDVRRSLYSENELEIQPGDDNISWGSRRNKSNAPVQDLWNSMASEDALPESLLLKRPPIPHTASAKSGASATRPRRDISPPDLIPDGPGSWPRLEESPQPRRYQQSPGSWPTLDQSRQSLYETLDTPLEKPSNEGVDNKRAAMEASRIDSDGWQTPPEPAVEPAVEPAADLAMSRIFTHEEAQSMYMSAMAHSSKLHVPGGWSENQPESSFSDSSKQDSVKLPPQTSNEPLHHQDDEDLAYGEQQYITPENVTPRAQSPVPSASILPDTTQLTKRASRQLLYVDVVTVWIPAKTDPSEQEEPLKSSAQTRLSNTSAPSMPGTFSMYSEMSASRRKLPELARQDNLNETAPQAETSSEAERISQITVAIGTVRGQIDISCGRLLSRLATKAATELGVLPGTKPEQGKSKGPSSNPVISVSMQHIWLAFKESAVDVLSTPGASDPANCLVGLSCGSAEFFSSDNRTELRVASFATFIGPSRLLSFNRARDMTASVIIDEKTPDIALALTSRQNKLKQLVPELTIEILPIDVNIDLPAIDETFDSFGGLSGILDVGNSILSESGMMSSPTSPTKLAKGVRFEGDSQPTTPELKVNARVGGLCAVLRGSACSVELRTSSIKAIYRERGVTATTENAFVSGPYLEDDGTASVSVQLRTLRLDYLLSPEHRDLERLLTLLTPSKDKYDNDDDILLDTLFRQRNKGAVIRASVNAVKFKCDGWDWVPALSSLGSELNKLSVVAKYLPEDERPGILSLIRVKDIEAHLPVNDAFGLLSLGLSDFQCAHVGLPALLALSIGDVKASHIDHGELLHSLIPLSGAESSPMVMARMLGDEVEPTVKVKLYNLCVEYAVSVVLSLSGLGKETDTEGMVSELARSVANLATTPHRVATTSDMSDSPSSKKMKLDLLIHDSAIGLTPQTGLSKGLLVLTDARFSTVVPPEEPFIAQLKLRKAGLFVADEVFADGIQTQLTSRSTPSNSSTKARITLSLSKQGFVSVGSIMAAEISVQLSESADDQAKTVEVEVRNELLLLETCADSTQTLIAVLNGLAPPKPPSKQPKYLTEPITIEDMMASFTGEAFEKPSQPPRTLFDVEEESEDDPAFMLDVPTLGEDDDGLLADSDMTSSLYGPVSGVLGVMDDLEDEDGDPAEFPETVESLLEDDPFEMTDSPADALMSDAALMRELNKQRKPVVNDSPVDLPFYEPKDLGLENLVAQHRMDLPGLGDREVKRTTTSPKLPFTMKLRDLHVIWNMYDGYDWQRTRDGITHAVEQVEIKAEERKMRHRQSVNDREDDESVIGDFLFNSIYIGVPSNQDAQELRRQINRGIDDLVSETESVPVSGISRPTTAFSSSGRPLHQRQRKRLKLERSKTHKIAFELKGISVDVLVFPEDSSDLVSTVDVRVRDCEVFDHVPNSTWRKFLTLMNNEPGAREMSKPMFHIELLNVRTLENFAASEIVLHVAVLPLRLHVDQDALDFITRFFEFKDDRASPAPSPDEQPFLQRVEVDTVDLCLDYKPKKVDYAGLRSGHTTEFMNFIILEACNIRLKHAIIYGIKGFEPLHKTLNDIWMPDVKRNQLPTVLAGLAPVRSLVNIGSGVRDVIAIPVREYQKDGRIVRSIQKGAFQFGKTTASELARLGAKVAIGTQTLLKGAEEMLTPTSGSPGRPSPARRHSSEQGWHEMGLNDDEDEPRAISAYANQPLGVLSGLRSARRYLEYDLLTARDALIAVQGEILESSGPTAAAAAMAKHAPTVILRPFIGTSRAVGTALLGVGNQIDRSNARRIEDKYKKR